jgi:hypothetical protein
VGQGCQRNLTSIIKTYRLSLKLLPKKVGRGMGSSGLHKKHKACRWDVMRAVVVGKILWPVT